MTLEFRNGEDGTASLALPTRWAGETLNSMFNLRVISPDASVSEGANADTKTVHAPPNLPVAVAYDLKKDWTGPLVHPMQFHPVLMSDYLEFTGSNALVRLKLEDGVTTTTNFDWLSLPAAWTLATSFGTATAAAGRCQTYVGPWIDVVHGLYAAGDFRLRPFQIGRRQAILAVRGAWTFTDDEAIADLQKVIGLVRDFWQDDDFPYFLVTLKPYDRDRGSSDGSAFTNAFWMYVSRLDGFAGLLPQLAHESVHAWIPARMGALSRDGTQDISWFNEGFTSYYGPLLVYRAGAMSAEDYLDSLNRDLRRFPTSSDPYIRGRIIALWLDAAIRRESLNQRSLDDVMIEMVRSRDQPLTLGRILETAGRPISAVGRDLLQRAVVAHGELAAPDQLPAIDRCARASLQEFPTFELGLDLARSRAMNQIAGVVEGGAAFVAGLRDGQIVTRISVTNGDPDRLARFTIQSEAGDRDVTFYPRGKAVPAWQYHFDPAGPCGRVP